MTRVLPLLILPAILSACSGGGDSRPASGVRPASPTVSAGASSTPETALDPTSAAGTTPTPRAALASPTSTLPQPATTPGDASGPDVLPRVVDVTATLESARAAYAQGDFAGAAELFAAAAVPQAGPLERATALLGRAKAQLAVGDPQAALDTLDVILGGEGPEAARLPALYLRARARFALGDYRGAAADYLAYAEAGGPAAAFARQDAAAALVKEGREVQAEEQLEIALRSFPGPRQLPALLLALAASYDRSGRLNLALETYGRLERETSSRWDAALALLQMGRVALRLGDGLRWETHLTTAITLYPEAPAAATAVDELTAGGRPPSGVLAGTVYYKSFRDEQAERTLAAFLEAQPAGPGSAQAAYYLATSLERMGRLGEAVRWYDRSLELEPWGPFAEKALWWGAVNADATGDYTGAVDRYRTLSERFPTSKFAPDAGFRIALSLYRQGDFLGAAERWRADAERTTGESRSRALLWRGKALERTGDAAGARASWQAALEGSDGDFYALRAELLLQGRPNEPLGDISPPLNLPAASLDWAGIEGWLASFSPRPASVVDPTSLPAWHSALALSELGEERRMADQLSPLLDEYQGRPWSLLALMRGLHEQGLTGLAARAVARLYGQAPASLQLAAPRDLYTIAFPLPHLEAAAHYAEEHGVPLLLLYALIRQESFFDPMAVSSAGALGLAQVMPATGQEIAAALGVPDFRPELLLQPELSLRFGAYYLGKQLETFGGNPYFALTAYNAGFGNARRLSHGGTAADLDLYVQDIDLQEAQLYVRYVLQNYARYLWVYGGAERPSLVLSP